MIEFLINFYKRYFLGIKSSSVREVATGRFATRYGRGIKRAEPRWISDLNK